MLITPKTTKTVKIAALAALFSVGLNLFFASSVSADYQAGRIIDDAIFTNSGAMTSTQIQEFLNSRSGVLKSKTFVMDCDSPTIGNTAKQAYLGVGAPCGSTIPAAQIIYYSSKVYGINPQVIMGTLQKEQSLITATNPTSTNFNRAMGYMCPTSGGCDGAYGGFFSQVDNGTWVLRKHFERARGNMTWWKTETTWTCGNKTDDNAYTYYRPGLVPGQAVTFYDGNGYNKGGVAYATVGIVNPATSSMYCYTPHTYNNPPTYGTVGQYYSGSYNFVNSFEAWFGSTTGTGGDLTNSLGTNKLAKDTIMRGGDYITSPDGMFVTIMQYDGNLVTYNKNKAVWDSHTAGNFGAYAKFQNDGNFVIYKINDSYGGYDSATNTTGADSVTLEDDGNLHIYAGSTQNYVTGFKVNASANTNKGTGLSSGAVLSSGDYIKSPNSRYTLVMQADGNLVLYTADANPVWNSGTWGQPGAIAAMQTDGHLVIYSSGGKPLWGSNTAGKGASTLSLQNDGNLVLYAGSTPTWHTGTWLNNYQMKPHGGSQVTSGTQLSSTEYIASSDGRYRLLMQADGNLVLYSVNKYRAIWDSGTWGQPGAIAAMQTDGHLVIYSSGGKPLWGSNTAGKGASTLSLQNDGNLVLYAGSTPTFASRTDGQF